jgi:hypothetical protein
MKVQQELGKLKSLIQQLKNKTETSNCNRNQSKKITSRKQTSLVGDNENLRAGSGERSRKWKTLMAHASNTRCRTASRWSGRTSPAQDFGADNKLK